MLIYTPQITNRFRYVAELLMEELIGIPLEITDNIDTYLSHHGLKLNYSKRRLSDEEIFIYTQGLLFEKGIKTQQVAVGTYKEIAVLFPCTVENVSLPFDIFAASFYLVSRYEEYLPFTPDRHNRYQVEDSIAYKADFLHLPVVNIWANFLREICKEKQPDIRCKQRSYKFLPTYDIDLAYSYKHKGFMRNLGRCLIYLKDGKWEETSELLKVWLFNAPDPYDTYSLQTKLHQQHKLHATYFFLIGEYSRYDKNISIENLAYQKLIRDLADNNKVGIHPSYRSNKDPKILHNEIEKLSAIIKTEVERSRQHYIKLRIPQTYETLLSNEIYKDYSMGYASAVGFRAGIASAFYFYNINLEIKTDLRVYPFCIMDVTLKEYLQLKPQKAQKLIYKLIEQVRKVNGLFIFIWHNHTISDYDDWQGWQQVYINTLEKALAVRPID
ncbi:MAG: polysaccharide deacetylase family protein [Chitinophagales bacterium]|nr:polysaccharide deacetylase family protein [Bacteroidota bacterium]